MTTARPLRADAERNRGRILEAAGTLFAERGLDVSIEEIASAAGVGVGTLYRRFADRDALIEALFEDKIESIVQLARDGLADADPWAGLESFMRGACRLQAADRGLKEAVLSSDRGSLKLAAARDRIRPVATQVVQRAKDAGVLREDIHELDIPMLHFAVGYVADRMRDQAPEYWERLLTIFLDGLSPSRAQTRPLPAAPLDPDQFARGLAGR